MILIERRVFSRFSRFSIGLKGAIKLKIFNCCKRAKFQLSVANQICPTVFLLMKSRISASVSATQSVARSVNAIIKRQDVPHQKARVERQLKYLRRLSYWGYVCLFVNTVYLSYRAKCALDARFRLSLLDSIIAGAFLSLELSFARKSLYITYASKHDTSIKPSSKLSWLYRSRIMFEKAKNETYFSLGGRRGSHSGHPDNLLRRKSRCGFGYRPSGMYAGLSVRKVPSYSSR